MRARTLSWVSLGLLLVDGVAAATTLVGTTVNPTGFTGLIVGGTSYDATFSTNSYNRLFTGTAPGPIFANNGAGAVLSEAPLSEFLTAAGVTGLGGVPCDARPEICIIFIPVSADGSSTNGTFVKWGGPGGWINGAGDPGLNVSAPAGDSVCFPNGCTYYLEYAVLTLTPTSHAAKYTVTALGLLSGGTFTQAYAINNAGQVAGTGDELYSLNGAPPAPVMSAIVWNGKIPTVIEHGDPVYNADGSSPVAAAINESGDVVGSFFNKRGAFFWSTSFQTDLPGSEFAFADGINDSGEIVGTSTPFLAQPFSATFWASATSDPTELAPPAGFIGVTTSASGINAAGTIVGSSSTNSSGKFVMRATLWNGATVTDLGTLGGTSSGAAAINASGHIVGWADIKNNLQHAALWGEHTRASDLGTLGGKRSYASGINVEGDVAGSAQTKWGVWHAVLWTHKHFKAIDLNAEISEKEAQEVTLTDAVGTNDRCMIVANGFDNKSKALESFVLSLTDQANCNEQ